MEKIQPTAKTASFSSVCLSACCLPPPLPPISHNKGLSGSHYVDQAVLDHRELTACLCILSVGNSRLHQAWLKTGIFKQTPQQPQKTPLQTDIETLKWQDQQPHGPLSNKAICHWRDALSTTLCQPLCAYNKPKGCENSWMENKTKLGVSIWPLPNTEK